MSSLVNAGLGALTGGTTTAIDGATGGLLSGLTGSVTDKLLGSVTSVFSNGFDFSCVGSSNSPSKAKTDVPKDLKEITEQSGIGTAINTTTVNKFVAVMTWYISAKQKSANNNSNANCTQKGNALSVNIATGYLAEVLNEVEKTHILTENGTVTQSSQPIHFKWRNDTLNYIAQITSKKYIVAPRKDINVPSNGNSNENKENTTPTNAKANTSQAGGGVFSLLIWGFVASFLANKFVKK